MLSKATENLRISILPVLSSKISHLVENTMVWLTVTWPILQEKLRNYIFRLRR